MPGQEEIRPVNCWQYSRDVYLLGRSIKWRIVSEEQRTALKDFIIAMAETRPAYVPYVNLKADNPPANEFQGEAELRKLAWDKLELQNNYSLGKMVQKLGRSLKIQFCSNDEKLLCDDLFAAFAAPAPAPAEDESKKVMKAAPAPAPAPVKKAAPAPAKPVQHKTEVKPAVKPVVNEKKDK